MPSEHQSRREIVQLGRMLHEKGFIAATDGNLSVRLDQRRILITPTGMSKGAMRPGDLVVSDMDGRRLKGKREITSEVGMHLLIYRMRPDIQAIVHAHPRTATGFAAAGIALNQPLVCEVVIGLGQIPLAPYGTPGTPELARTLVPLVPDYDAILMANHGVVTYGADLRSAYMKMETVEHFAQITLVTRMLGQQQPLAHSDLEKLLEVRSRYMGVNSAAAMPVYSGNGNGNGVAKFPSLVPANGVPAIGVRANGIPANGKALPQRASLRTRPSLRPRGNAVPLEN